MVTCYVVPVLHSLWLLASFLIRIVCILPFDAIIATTNQMQKPTARARSTNTHLLGLLGNGVGVCDLVSYLFWGPIFAPTWKPGRPG